ncbi:hypothetical protein B0H17DRAFT_1328622 [Mycena rosella]|uniref:Nuclear condensin complex subunit 3 C-terminal domain-containing protein n=1 Tax=Mycena rosella TaxID=1033263 RepID=A0AAD7GP34_MYCRO|nr:hypothetical protein B0H17DRAFT_1328622 [Mycena rosella]
MLTEYPFNPLLARRSFTESPLSSSLCPWSPRLPATRQATDNIPHIHPWVNVCEEVMSADQPNQISTPWHRRPQVLHTYSPPLPHYIGTPQQRVPLHVADWRKDKPGVARVRKRIKAQTPSKRELICVVIEIVMDLREPEEEDQDTTLSTVPTQSSMTRSLQRAKGMLECVHGSFEESSTLEGILADLIIPAVRRTEVGIRKPGLVGLRLCCLIAKSIPIKSLQLFLSQGPKLLLIRARRRMWGNEIRTFLADWLEAEDDAAVQAMLCIRLGRLLLAELTADPKVYRAPLPASLLVKLSILLHHVQAKCSFDDATLDRVIASSVASHPTVCDPISVLASMLAIAASVKIRPNFFFTSGTECSIPPNFKIQPNLFFTSGIWCSIPLNYSFFTSASHPTVCDPATVPASAVVRRHHRFDQNTAKFPFSDIRIPPTVCDPVSAPTSMPICRHRRFDQNTAKIPVF